MFHRYLISALKLYLFIYFAILIKAHAVVVDDLYSIELPVADQTTTQRLQVFRQAFEEVLIKVSGDKRIVSRDDLARPLKNSARYVLQYRYLNRRDQDAESFDAGQLYLRVQFNQDVLEKLLRQFQIPIWGKERPSTLMLVSVDVNKKVSVVSGDTTPDFLEVFDRSATRKGIPVLFPLLDLEDRMLMGVEDIIEINENSIQALTDRYAPDAVLVGKVSGRIGQGWSGEWQARVGNRLVNWTFKASTRDDLINQAMSNLAQNLASEYALRGSNLFQDTVLLRIMNVDNLTQYNQVLKYLVSLNAVESARAILFASEQVTYQLDLRNSIQDLQQLINLGDVLEPLELPVIDTTQEQQTVVLNYQLLR